MFAACASPLASERLAPRLGDTWRHLALKLPFQGRGPNVSEGYELESDVLMV